MVVNVKSGLDAGLEQSLGRLLALPLREAVDDPGLAAKGLDQRHDVLQHGLALHRRGNYIFKATGKENFFYELFILMSYVL
jgi:hypothetical protein